MTLQAIGNNDAYSEHKELMACEMFSGYLVEAQYQVHVEIFVSCEEGLNNSIYAVSGIIYTLLAGQPLILLGPTGFMVVITGALYRVRNTCP